jgi:RNA polymerase sigma-70 factor (ECF subfamily)
MPAHQSARLAAGQLDQLGYERYGPPLLGYILRIVGRAADAEDILQECFIRALAFLDTDEERDEAHYRRWLYQVATNLCHDALRRHARTRRRAVPLDAPAAAGDESHDGVEPGALIDPAMSFPSHLAHQQLIEQVFARMEPGDVSALLLSDHLGFALREVAQMLECSYAAAAKRVGRARERFARHYRELGGEEVDR